MDIPETMDPLAPLYNNSICLRSHLLHLEVNISKDIPMDTDMGMHMDMDMGMRMGAEGCHRGVQALRNEDHHLLVSHPLDRLV